MCEAVWWRPYSYILLQIYVNIDILYFRYTIFLHIWWKFILAMRMTYIQDLKELLKAKLYKNSGCAVCDASTCMWVSDASTCMWAYLSRLEGVSLIMPRLLMRRPIISPLSYTLFYCILKMHNTFLMWLVAWRMGLSYHIAWLHCFTIALTWIDTYTLICIRICIKTDGSENE